MTDENFQTDLFGSGSRTKKEKKVWNLPGYAEQRVLPFIRIPIEYTVIFGIVVLVLIVVSYAVGVERGKGMAQVNAINVDYSQEIMVKEPAQKSSGKNAPLILKEVEAELFDEGISVEETEKELMPPEKSVPVSVSSAKQTVATDTKASYTVQLISYKSEKYCSDEIEKLKKDGVDARMEKKGDIYQIYATGYSTMDEARKAQDKLSKKYPDCYIRRIK